MPSRTDGDVANRPTKDAAAGKLSFDAYLARRAADPRFARLTHDIGLPKGRGLEFGPGDNATPMSTGHDVAYVDHSLDVDAETPGAVVVDHAWAGSGSLVSVLGRDGYDFAIAAQVAQYVPNLLGWFRGIHAALRPGGVLNLSLPDKRFMFDAARPCSTLAELVDADLAGLDRPSARQVFAHTSEARDIAPERIWAGEDPAAAPRMAGPDALARAYAQAGAASHSYVPCHCWVFTPASFLDRLEKAARLGLFSLVLNNLAEAQPGGCEFFVSMRRDVEDDPEALRGLQDAATAHLRSGMKRRRTTAALLAR